MHMPVFSLVPVLELLALSTFAVWGCRAKSCDSAHDQRCRGVRALVLAPTPTTVIATNVGAPIRMSRARLQLFCLLCRR